jgi:hypothetical protein
MFPVNLTSIGQSYFIAMVSYNLASGKLSYLIAMVSYTWCERLTSTWQPCLILCSKHLVNGKQPCSAGMLCQLEQPFLIDMPSKLGQVVSIHVRIASLARTK